MKYRLIKKDGLSTLILTGEIDLHFSSELRKIILDVFENKMSLTIDLDKVSYLDSSGVACFVEAYQLSKSNALEFNLTNISHAAMQVIKLARLDTVFPVQ